MVEKAVIVHRSAIEEWNRRKISPVSLLLIQQALRRIDDVIKTTSPVDVILVVESPNTGFVSLPTRVGMGNSARLYGARVGHCLKLARTVLENAGISVSLDSEGSLP